MTKTKGSSSTKSRSAKSARLAGTDAAEGADQKAKKTFSVKRVQSDQLTRGIKAALSPDGTESANGSQNHSLARLLDSAGLSSIMVISGDQALRMRRIVAWMCEQLIADKNSGYSCYYGSDLAGEGSMQNLISAMTSPSLFAPRQIVVIHEMEKMRVATQKLLLAAVERIDSSVALIATCGSSPAATSFPSQLASHGVLVEVKDLTEAELIRWIDRELQRVTETKPGAGSSEKSPSIKFESGAAQLLAQAYGNDLAALASEIERLSLLVDPGEVITQELVKQHAPRTGDANGFELLRAIASGNTSRAATLAATSVARDMHPLQVSSFLSRCYRILVANRSPGSAAGLPADLGNPWFVKQISQSSSRFPAERIAKGLKTLADLDFALKDSKFTPLDALLNAVTVLCMG